MHITVQCESAVLKVNVIRFLLGVSIDVFLGLRVSEYVGGLHPSASLDVILASCDPEKAIFAVLNHSGIQLDERSNVYLQAAILYTTVFGQRRVRVCNLALPISAMAGNVFKFADQEAVVSLWIKQGMTSGHLTNMFT